MNRIISIILFSLMFSQTELTTRVYEMNITWSQNAEQFNFNLEDIVGIELDSAIINFYALKEADYFGSDLDFEVYLNNDYPDDVILAKARYKNQVGLVDHNDGYGIWDTNFIYSSSLNYIIRVLQDFQGPGSAILEFAVTAEFPLEDQLQGDMNDDNSLDILDILAIVNIIVQNPNDE